MANYQSHLTLLRENAEKYASLPALRVPCYSPGGTVFEGWRTVTHSQFLNDVEQSARYWAHELSKQGLKERSIVGVWLKGLSYSDALQIWGISRAGFIPQMISIRMTSPVVVYELLHKSGAKALVFDSAFTSILDNSPLPTLPAIDTLHSKANNQQLKPMWAASTAEDVVMIFHTSGSTSESPKMVPLTAKWFDFLIAKSKFFGSGNHPLGTQKTMVISGSFCHLGTTIGLLSVHNQGGCYVVPSSLPYSSDEVVRMAKECQLTTLFIFSSFLGNLIREARTNDNLLATLQAFESVVHGGLPLVQKEGEWARTQGINLINLLASTEVALSMQSRGGTGADAELMSPFPGTSYSFVPLSAGTDKDMSPTGEVLLELVVNPESPDCPRPSFRNKEDGRFYTGDLFVEVEPGKYLLKGRSDDWIKMEISLRCDALSIENNALETCGKDLIHAAVAVGSGRPSPVLFVEPKDDSQMASETEVSSLRNQILHRIAPFHERRYVHERIEDTRYIVVVPTGTLPRTVTKGNIRRRVTEEMYQKELDDIFSA